MESGREVVLGGSVAVGVGVDVDIGARVAVDGAGVDMEVGACEGVSVDTDSVT